MRNMRTIWLASVALLLALVWAGGMAWAASPHFIDSKTKVTINNDGDLIVNFKEAGLGANIVDYTFSATVEATWTCVNKSGRCPQAANKVTTSDELVAIGSFIPKHGTVSATLGLRPVSPESAPPTCGGGQDLELSEVSYTNILLVDTSNVVTANLPTTAGPVTFFTCP